MWGVPPRAWQSYHKGFSKVANLGRFPNEAALKLRDAPAVIYGPVDDVTDGDLLVRIRVSSSVHCMHGLNWSPIWVKRDPTCWYTPLR